LWETDLLISRTQAIAHAKELRLVRETTQANYVGGVVRLMRFDEVIEVDEVDEAGEVGGVGCSVSAV